MTIVSNCESIEKQIKASLANVNRKEDDLTCVAVTKTRSSFEVAEIYRLGYRHFGENRLEGLIERQAEFGHSDIKWHFIGSLQTRKVKDVINRIDYFHALDRESLAKEINKRAEQAIACFVQVNVTGETSKHGVSPAELPGFIEKLALYPKIQVVGLMTMAPIDADDSVLRACFKDLKKLQEVIAERELPYAPCQELSMGMSRDFTLAIEEGATVIRVGSAFFED